MFWGRYLILAVLKKVKNQLRRRGKSLEMHFQKEIFLLMILLQQRRMGDLKGNYADYMTTEPINCNEEL